ncbi:hypothetical protein [Streptomyces atroolivaceus]
MTIRALGEQHSEDQEEENRHAGHGSHAGEATAGLLPTSYERHG